MTADDRAAKLELHLDRLLAEPERAGIDATLANDPVLGRELALARAIDGALRRRCAPPVGLGERVGRRLGAGARPRRMRGALLLAAATIVAAAGAWLYLRMGGKDAQPAGAGVVSGPGDPGQGLEACKTASPIESLLQERLAAARIACGLTLDLVRSKPADETGFEKFEFVVDGKPVWLWIGADERAKRARPPQSAGLHVFEGVLEGRRVLEVTPLDKPRLLQHLQITVLDEPREMLRELGYAEDPPEALRKLGYIKDQR